MGKSASQLVFSSRLRADAHRAEEGSVSQLDAFYRRNRQELLSWPA